MGIPMPPNLEAALLHIVGALAETRTGAIRDAAQMFNLPESTVRAALAEAEIEHFRRVCACFVVGALAPRRGADEPSRGYAWVNGGCAHHPATGTAVDPADLITHPKGTNL